MPGLHRDPTGRSPYWYCPFTNSDGKRSFKSTKQKKFKDAEIICREWDEAARKGREQTLTEVQVRKVLGDIYERTNGEKIEFETVASYFKDNGGLF